jgi:DNA-directed RNA polymerase beta subunit
VPEETTHDIPERKLKQNFATSMKTALSASVLKCALAIFWLVKLLQKARHSSLLKSAFCVRSSATRRAMLKTLHCAWKTASAAASSVSKYFLAKQGHQLESGIIKRIHIESRSLRTVSVGDKLAGRHGNKGVISRILPEEDMPYMEDGRPLT